MSGPFIIKSAHLTYLSGFIGAGNYSYLMLAFSQRFMAVKVVIDKQE